MKPLVDKDYLLDKFPCKGGWTYTLIPEIKPDPHAPFGWVRVRGTIDNVDISDYHLMPWSGGSGLLFLSVKAALRKRIKKEAGDTVHVVLWRDDATEVPDELLACIADDPDAAAFFDTLSADEKHQFVRWIYSVATEKTRIERIAKAIEALAEKRKFAKLFIE